MPVFNPDAGERLQGYPVAGSPILWTRDARDDSPGNLVFGAPASFLGDGLYTVLWAHLNGVGSFHVDALAAFVDTARTSNHDWGALTIFDQPLADSGVLWGLGQAAATAPRFQNAIYSGDLRDYTTTVTGSPQLNSTIAGSYGPEGTPEMLLVEYDHQVTSQVVTAWTSSDGPHAVGSFLDGAFWAPDIYAIGAWPNQTGDNVRFTGHILAHLFWYAGGNVLLTGPQVAAIQAAFNAAGSVKTRVTATIEEAKSILGSKAKFAMVFNPGASPSIGDTPVVNGTVEYTAIS